MITILHEETQFMLINKPTGLFSQAAAGIASVQTTLRKQLKERDSHSGTPFVGLPHRLDRGTSGVMLIARNQRALKRFGQQFQSRKIGKYYLALVNGCNTSAISGDQFTRWEDYLVKVPDEPRAIVVPASTEGAKMARLEARLIAEHNELRLVLVRLLTGRMHQIRVQSAARGMPVFGDPTYGNATSDENPVQLGLHALRLEFRHPKTARAMSATAPPSGTMWDELPGELKRATNELVAESQRELSQTW